MKQARRFLELLGESALNQTFDVCSRWSYARRWMPAQDNEPAGWYSKRNYPWVEEILNSRAKYNWVMKGAQTGLTECGINRAFFEVDYHEKDVMYLMPTGKKAEQFSKTRFANAIKLSPYLKDRVIDSLPIKQIGRATLYINGANNEINIKGTPVDRLVMDEMDELTERQIFLALERLSGRRDKLVWGMSTPKIPNTGVHKQFIRSTQEHFYFDCPHCTEEIELLWEDSFELFGEYVDDPECRKSYLKCSKCQKKLDHEAKSNWLANGRWKPTNADADPDSRGFWLSQLYSPTVNPFELAVAFLRGRGDEAARMEFHNSKLGLPYIEDGSQVNDGQVNECLKKYQTSTLVTPLGCKDVITLGIDQGKPHYWAAVKWTLNRDCQYGDVNDRAKGQLIGYGKVDQSEWIQGLAPLMRQFQVKMAVVDYLPEPTPARQFARTAPGYIWLCQYVVGRVAREITRFEDEYGANVAKVDKVSWLSKTLGRVMAAEIELPFDLSDEFRRHLKNNVRRQKKHSDGNYVTEYITVGEDHFAHALNYAEIALAILDPSIHKSDVLSSIY